MVYAKKIDQDVLIEKAYELVEREGLEALSMRRLAQILGVRPSSLYNHFSDKSELLFTIATRGLFQLARSLQQVYELAQPDPGHQLYMMGMTYREWALQHPQLYHLLFTEKEFIDEAASESSDAAFAPLLAATRQMLGEAHAATAAQAIWAFAHGFIMLELTGHMQHCIPVEGFQRGLMGLIQGLAN